MSGRVTSNTAASIRARLKNAADELGLSFDQTLQYYVMERFLFRLSQTNWADALVVKGAAMLRVWDGAVARPTRDIDFLGRTDSSVESIEAMVRACIGVAVEDGIEFQDTVVVEPITVEDRYPGARAVIRGALSGARFVLRIDVGINDSVVPEPGWVKYPTLLDMESPQILAYQPSTAVAEKMQTMIEKGLLNSRLKDYYDIWMLSQAVAFDGPTLRDALIATFGQRDTAIPTDVPSELTDEYASQPVARAQWATFVKKMRASGIEAPDNLLVLVGEVAQFLMPAVAAAAAGEAFDLRWEPGRGWGSKRPV